MSVHRLILLTMLIFDYKGYHKIVPQVDHWGIIEGSLKKVQILDPLQDLCFESRMLLYSVKQHSTVVDGFES
jgi:hypothetical protein